MVDTSAAFTKAMLAVSNGIAQERQNRPSVSSQGPTGFMSSGSRHSGVSDSAGLERMPSFANAYQSQTAAPGDDVNRNLRKHAVSGRCWARFIDMLEWWEDIAEPTRSGRLFKVVHSDAFENCSGAVILANCAFAGYLANWHAQHLGEQTLFSMQVLEFTFLAYYTVEIALRLAVHGAYFFVNRDARWNCFDFGLLVLAFDELILSRLVINAKRVNIGFLRILRLMRMAKILRTLRVMKVFKELAVILDSFKTCFVSLFWCFVMMFFIFYVFALVLLQGMTAHLEEVGDQMTDEDLASVKTYYANLGTTMMSLYMAVTGGDDWGNAFAVVRFAGETYAALFLFFTFFFMFAVMNILTGVFVDKAMAAAEPSAEARILESQQQNMLAAATLRHLCTQMDADGDGSITIEELQHHMTNDYFLVYLSSIGLHIRDTTIFFDLLSPLVCKDSESIPVDSLVEGFLSWKGAASALDMHKQMLETDEMRKQLAAQELKIFEAVLALETRIAQKEAKLPSRENSEDAKKSKDFGGQASSSSQHHTQPANLPTEVELMAIPEARMPDSLQPKLDKTVPDEVTSALERLEKEIVAQRNCQPLLDSLREELMSGLVPEMAASIFYFLEARLANRFHSTESHSRSRKDSPDTRSSEDMRPRSTPDQSEKAVSTSTKRRRPPAQHEFPEIDEALRAAFAKEARRSWPLPKNSDEGRLIDMLRAGPLNANETAGI